MLVPELQFCQPGIKRGFLHQLRVRALRQNFALSMTMILSALRTVASRWAMTSVVRPSVSFSSAC